jgi:hypothetical protein
MRYRPLGWYSSDWTKYLVVDEGTEAAAVNYWEARNFAHAMALLHSHKDDLPAKKFLKNIYVPKYK